MTLEQFYFFSLGYRQSQEPGQRAGQALFSALAQARPQLAERLREESGQRRPDAQFDPFYDDTRIPRAWAWIVEHWGDDPQ